MKGWRNLEMAIYTVFEDCDEVLVTSESFWETIQLWRLRFLGKAFRHKSRGKVFWLLLPKDKSKLLSGLTKEQNGGE